MLASLDDANWEMISLSFIFDTTNDTLSNVHLIANGPWAPGLTGTLPNQVIFNTSNSGVLGIEFMTFQGPTSSIEISNEGLGSGTVIPAYATVTDRPLWLFCTGCEPTYEGEHDWIETVTAIDTRPKPQNRPRS